MIINKSARLNISVGCKYFRITIIIENLSYSKGLATFNIGKITVRYARRVTPSYNLLLHKIKNGDKARPSAYRDYYIFTVIRIHRPRLQCRQALVPCNSPRLYSDISASALILSVLRCPYVMIGIHCARIIKHVKLILLLSKNY